MKNWLFLLLFCVPFMVLGQSLPLQWTAQTKRTSANTYDIQVHIQMPAGWYVYAQQDTALGLEAPGLSWNDTDVQASVPVEITVAPSTIADPLFDNQKLSVYKKSFTLVQPVTINGAAPASLLVRLNGFAAGNGEFLPLVEEAEIHFEGGVNLGDKLKLSSVNSAAPLAKCGEVTPTGNNLFTIFLLGFLGGLIALLTPCVFPMIPVTVSFFTNRAPNHRMAIRNGVVYGLFITGIYIAASIPFHLMSSINPEIFNNISTNATLNIIFFLIFLVFAASFFGLFEITLPSALANTAGSKGGMGLSGIFFMALTLAIVSFSCTGPILGSLLVGSLSAAGSAWQLTVGMGGFGLALALPFALFAIFPHWLKTLPKSGGWLNTVKKVLAFIELGLAFKFLSNADLVMHWGILKREVFIGIWLLIALALALYLLGFFNGGFKGRKTLIGTKGAIGVLALVFALYLVPGLTNSQAANLKLLSGFPPPLSYSVYSTGKGHSSGVVPQVMNDYDKALQLSIDQQKPLLIDFTGWACVNCRKMEEQVWTIPEVSAFIKENFILISLYVDDRKPLEEPFTYKTTEGKAKELKTVGDKWATFQSENFNQVTQPLYVILSPGQELLNYPVGYTPDSEKYLNWLQCGLDAYKKSLTNANRKIDGYYQVDQKVRTPMAPGRQHTHAGSFVSIQRNYLYHLR